MPVLMESLQRLPAYSPKRPSSLTDMAFPQTRPRRLRQNPALRELVAEVRLGVSDLVAPHQAALREQMLALIDVYGVDDEHIGTPDTLDMLFPICGSLQTRAQAVVAAAQAAGLSDDSLAGLSAGDRVITVGAFQVSEGTRVEF